MQAHTAYSAHAPALAPRRSDDGAMPALYRAAVGPIHTSRYLAFFERQDDTGRTLASWNWAAALCTLNWMVFRQLWGAALVYVAALEGVALLVFALGHQVLGLPLPVLAGLVLAWLAAACVLPGLYGDAILHAEVRKKITKALSASATMPQARERLERQAASRRRLGWIVLANVAIALLAAGLWFAFPDGGRAALDRIQAPERAPSAAAAAPIAAASIPRLPPADPASQEANPSVVPVEPPAEAPALTEAATRMVPSSDTANVPAPAAAAASAPLAPAAPVAPAATSSASASTTPTRAASMPAAATPVPRKRPASTPGATAAAPAAPARAAAASRAAPASLPAAASAVVIPPLPASAPAERKLYINVGLFGDADNARRAHARLREAELPASMGEVKMSSGRKLTRVRVGPFSSTAEANAAAAKVREMGLDTAAAAQQ